MNQNVTLLAAFAAGFLSFVSPCVLPLIPGYISFVSGISVEEMRSDAAPAASRLQIFLTSLAFVIGFSIVFVALGASATAIGKLMFAKLPLLSKIAGAVLIVFGLHTMVLFRLAFLETEKRVHAQRKPAGPLGAMLHNRCVPSASTRITDMRPSGMTVGEYSPSAVCVTRVTACVARSYR